MNKYLNESCVEKMKKKKLIMSLGGLFANCRGQTCGTEENFKKALVGIIVIIKATKENGRRLKSSFLQKKNLFDGVRSSQKIYFLVFRFTRQRH